MMAQQLTRICHLLAIGAVTQWLKPRQIGDVLHGSVFGITTPDHPQEQARHTAGIWTLDQFAQNKPYRAMEAWREEVFILI